MVDLAGRELSHGMQDLSSVLMLPEDGAVYLEESCEFNVLKMKFMVPRHVQRAAPEVYTWSPAPEAPDIRQSKPIRLTNRTQKGSGYPASMQTYTILHVALSVLVADGVSSVTETTEQAALLGIPLRAFWVLLVSYPGFRLQRLLLTRDGVFGYNLNQL
ncbi:hypothetical protein AKJ16_DCAP09526 [Drosera capensis]